MAKKPTTDKVTQLLLVSRETNHSPPPISCNFSQASVLNHETMRLKSRLQLWVTVNMWWDSLASSCKYSFPYLLAKVTLFNFFLWSVPYLYVIQWAFRLEHNLLFVIYVWQNKHVSRIYECFVPINIRTIILYPTQNSLNYLRPNVY